MTVGGNPAPRLRGGHHVDRSPPEEGTFVDRFVRMQVDSAGVRLAEAQTVGKARWATVVLGERHVLEAGVGRKEGWEVG
jgi:hypothetical protein